MAAIFPRWTNWIPLAVLGTLGLGAPAIAGAVWYFFSPEYTDVGYSPKQPVAFSHKFHAGDLGLDCRYCHYTVEKSSYAAIPPTSVCMGCHTSIRPKSKKLALVRSSFKANKPIPWVRVHLLPDYVFFNHQVHVAAGVGCASCHGRVDKMTQVRQAKSLSMGWCLDCHRDPNPHLRPRKEVTNMAWKKGSYKTSPKEATRHARKDMALLREALLKETPLKPVRMAGKQEGKFSAAKAKSVVVNPPEHCSGCHR